MKGCKLRIKEFYKIFFILVIVVMTAIIATSHRTSAQDDSIQEIKICHNESNTLERPAFKPCVRQREVNICDDSDKTNSSCHKENKEFNEKCMDGKKEVMEVKESCLLTGYKTPNGEINTDGYSCTIEGNGMTIVCDSKYDGNGDGICTSGESCMKFDIGRYSTQKYEKNSQDTFTQNDKSFFLDKANVGEDAR